MAKDMPEQDELVLATVRKVVPYGAFCSLDEYGGREAFLHISQVAPRWIKNIREFLREGQHIVAHVYKFVPEKDQIDLSLKRVTEADRKRKLEESKKEKRGAMLLMLAARRMRVKKPEMDAVGQMLERKWVDLYSAFEKLSQEGEKALEGMEVSSEWRKTLLEIASENIKRQRARADVVLMLTSTDRNGVEGIKEALLSAKPKAGTELKITYMGAPRYLLSVTADDFRVAGKEAERIAKEVCEAMGRAGGRGSYEPVERK